MLHIFFITKSVFLFVFFLRITLKAGAHDDLPDLTGLVSELVYDRKPVHFPSISCKAIEWVQKTRQVYNPET